jgi:uncharacterized protein
MASIEEQIQELEDEIKKTDYNKATQQHIGRLKAKIARLKMEAEKRASSSGGGGKGYSVKKSGNGTVAFVGFPSVGKSTLLNILTGAESEVGSYKFTTLTVIPGLMEHRGAKIQLLDMPGIIKGAARGKGRGREVLSAVRSSDLIILMLDVFELNIEVILTELKIAGIRLNEKPADIFMSRGEKGGIEVHSTVEQTHLSDENIKSMLHEYGIVNANLVLRQNITDDQLLDYLVGNRIYIPAIVAINKIDIADPDYLDDVMERMASYEPSLISADQNIGIEDLKERVFQELGFIRLYLKPRGREADLEEPMIILEGSTVGQVCDLLHRDFRRNFRFANVWGKSARFPGQVVGINHTLLDEDILTIITR